MKISEVSIVVISHAGLRQINRAVYRELKKEVGNLKIILPAFIISSAGQSVPYEPEVDGDPTLVPMVLQGRNPRTYFYPGIVSALNNFNPDIILLENDPVSHLGIALSSWCRKKGKKIFCQSYENTKRGFRTTLSQRRWKSIPGNFILNVLYHYMAKKIDVLLVVNKESETLFKGYGYRSIVRIPLGYDPHVFFISSSHRQQFREQLQVQNETVVIAYFGRMVPQKGVHLLIQALQHLKSFNWMLLLDHAFDHQDEYTSYIRSLINEYQLVERVKYFEASHSEIADYMRASDIMVAPSLTTPDFKEQYGRAVQEAMACGCVCLVSDSGHLKDLVADVDLVFLENNPNAIKEMLVKWITDISGRMRKGTSLANHASHNLTSRKQAHILVDKIGRLS